MLTTKELNRKKQFPYTTTFHWHNENPKGNITTDCVFRAIGKATGLGWVATLRDLSEDAMDKCVTPTAQEIYISYIESMGFNPQKQPKKNNGTKYTGSQFCRWLDKTYKDAVVVAHIGTHHIVCISKVDGRFKVNDTWDSTQGCIGKWWVKEI